MSLEYFIFYIEANVVSILILGLLLINDRLQSTRQEKQIWFNRTIVVHILYFISDMCWAAVLSGQLPRTRLHVGLFNFSNLVLLSLLAYEWFLYMAASEEMPFRKSIRRRALCRIPIIVAVLVMVIAYIAAPEFWISAEGELNSWYYPMLIAVPVLYLMAAFFLSMANARKEKTREKKHLYRLIGIYPLGVLLFGLIQTFILNAPRFCLGCTVMMLTFYIQNLQAQISVDSLTRLNNRGQINRYMDQAQYRENTVITAMMLDIDRFKTINDTYGHGEGDRALILVSEALKQAAGKLAAPVFLGRYGGDEFTVFIQGTAGDGTPEQMIEAIRLALAEKQAKNRLPYDLEISVGYDSLKDKNDTMEACLARADEKLYEDKKGKGSLR